MLTREWLLADDSGEAAELTDQELGDFFDYMDECALGKEEKLVKLLKSVSYPADMSQLLVCVNMAVGPKRNSIAKSKKCMTIFVSWTQVQYSLFPPSFQSACDASCVPWGLTVWSMLHCTGA